MPTVFSNNSHIAHEINFVTFVNPSDIEREFNSIGRVADFNSDCDGEVNSIHAVIEGCHSCAIDGAIERIHGEDCPTVSVRTFVI